jgi:predicted HicB family RNase H-like nuclease
MINNALEYKGYHGSVEYSAPDHCFHGRILGIRSFILYEGVDADSIEQDFHEAVDDYLDLCKSKGLEPEKEYSGTFQVRIAPDTHRELMLQAEARGKKMNAVVSEALDRYVKTIS